MNDSMDRAETAIQKFAEQNVKLAETIKALAEGQKHTDEKLAALTDIVQRWHERHGNGSSGQHPS
jgi:hypothetical protein